MAASNNIMNKPKLTKIVLNVGISSKTKDPKFLETVRATLSRITGQKTVDTLAKKSISSFKIREGMVVGVMVTLRGRRMQDFLKKLTQITLPRTRDFWGLSPKHVDARGNFTLGLKEHLAFPEIRSDEVEHVHGLQITLVSTAKGKEQALAFYTSLGLPLLDS
ncbi:50S ribosomal protein L5 [Candidatus Uhrbacteria bacterium]|nr:50S ribosomal protein L5 [Candidatus Uhrbacteria bacterium]